jgi:hypothetical protein
MQKPVQPLRDSFPYTDRPTTITERLRLSGYAFRRAAWRLRYQLSRSDAPPHEPIVVVFGMHRSGTSAAVGILEDLGFTVPGTVVPEGMGDNKRGTRESIELTSLANRVLQLNASSWSKPPKTAVKYLKTHMADRDRIIRLCAGRRCVLKDPRMLLMLELWDGVLINPMAVVRNPIDVAESLLRRGEPSTQRQCIALWKIYNRALLDFAQNHDCPIAFFDHPNFADQVMRCTRYHGYSDSAATHFFEDRLVRSRAKNWRHLVGDSEAIALYDDLARFAVTGPRLSVQPDRTQGATPVVASQSALPAGGGP